jgi:hypothetical protein
MPIDPQTEAAFIERATIWVREQDDITCERCQTENESQFGNVGVVKGVYFDKDKQQPVGLPDGLVVPIECRRCNGVIMYYDELPEPPR